MTRLQLDLPAHTLFETTLTVQIGDINYGQHLSNDAVLRLCHEARLRFLHSLNYSEMNIEGCGLIMADAAIQFKQQAFYGDVLNFRLGIGALSSSGFALMYHIVRVADEIEIARIKTGMVFFDYAQQRVAKIPPPLLKAPKNVSTISHVISHFYTSTAALTQRINRTRSYI